MKAILMSIRPEWVAKILNGEKTIEVRKRFPTDYRGWVYIYCTKNDKPLKKCNHFLVYGKKVANDGVYLNGKVVARFWCDNVEEIPNYGLARRSEIMLEELLKSSCLTMEQLDEYAPHKEYKDDYIYAIHISQLEIFDRPKKLCEFGTLTNKCNGFIGGKKPLVKAPQSWQFIEVGEWYV